ncbi:putative pachytene checkpoint protein 2 [Aphelenchoides bicaudatus]|nr:putative pachytene checkpoint protein 2 [Aphelenchoides bicaudatus]
MSALLNDMENLNINNECPKSADVTIEARMKTGSTQSDGHEYKDKLLEYLKLRSPFQNWSSVSVVCPDLMSIFEYVLVGSSQETNEKDIHVDDESSFDLLWENLFYEDNVKGDLLSFVNSLVHLSQLGVDTNVVDLNRLILLHGPPGTGKTTLCKGLAQRLSVRLQHKYKKSVFVESGKFVQKLFEQIVDLASNRNWQVFVLIDEVESLVMERTACHGSDPSDSVRAVNAVLTQIDKIRRYPNIFIFTTSNITGALDQAFLDRADISRHIGHPSPLAAAKILHKCVLELNRIGAITGDCSESRIAFNLAQARKRQWTFTEKVACLGICPAECTKNNN